MRVRRELFSQNSLEHSADSSNHAIFPAIREHIREYAFSILGRHATRVQGGDERPSRGAGAGRLLAAHDTDVDELFPNADVIRKEESRGGEPDTVGGRGRGRG